MELGHTWGDGEAICERIREREKSGTLYKAAASMEVVKSGNDLILYGPATWELLDREGDLITTEAQVKFLRKLFTKAAYKAIMDEHTNFQAGEPLRKYVTGDGRTYLSHVHEKGLMLVAKVRPDDGLQKTKELRRKVLSGQYRSFSIAGRPIDFKEEFVKGQRIVYHYDIDPDEISLCKEGVNPKARFQVIQKSTQEKPRDTVASELDELKRGVRHFQEDLYKHLEPALRKFVEEKQRVNTENLNKLLDKYEDLQKYRFPTKEREKKDEDKRRTGQRLR